MTTYYADTFNNRKQTNLRNGTVAQMAIRKVDHASNKYLPNAWANEIMYMAYGHAGVKAYFLALTVIDPEAYIRWSYKREFGEKGNERKD